MKIWLLKIQIFIVMALVGLYLGARYKIKELQEENSIVYSNLKALRNTQDSLLKEKRVLYYTIEELKYSKDSIDKKLVTTINQLNIKKKNIDFLQYQLSKAGRTDTIRLIDTIFKNDIKIDTVLGDKWYRLKLGLEYPNKISINPTFTSSRIVIGKLHKETIKPPKKFFLWRLFQRKHKILTVEIIEENPYINSDAEKYIKIVK